MQVRYVAGFIDPISRVFYKNTLEDHKDNAKRIIQEKGWEDEWRNDKIMRREAPDFLVFRRGFIQVGNCNRRLIVVSEDRYKSDKHFGKVWRAVEKSLTEEQFLCVSNYKIIAIMTPRY